jgi:hypothetical protein
MGAASPLGTLGDGTVLELEACKANRADGAGLTSGEKLRSDAASRNAILSLPAYLSYVAQRTR